MHGEHKTPSGKLVVVDFEVREGKLSGVKVSGDFFLEPPEALADITASLEAAAAEATEEELANRVRESAGEETEMVGFSPEAVAKAVRKGMA